MGQGAKGRGRRPEVEALEGRRLLSRARFVPGNEVPPYTTTMSYKGDFQPLGGSGVSGHGKIVEVYGPKSDTEQQTLDLTVTGWERGRPHSVVVMTMTSPGQGQPGKAPLVSPAIVFTAAPAASGPVKSHVHFKVPKGRPMEPDSVIVFGKTVDGRYDPTVPVASAQLQFVQQVFKDFHGRPLTGDEVGIW